MELSQVYSTAWHVNRKYNEKNYNSKTVQSSSESVKGEMGGMVENWWVGKIYGGKDCDGNDAFRQWRKTAYE